MKIYQPGLFEQLPRIEFGRLKARLDNGEVYEFACEQIAAVIGLADCCGGMPVCCLHMTNGMDYRLDHQTPVVYALWDAWRRGDPAA